MGYILILKQVAGTIKIEGQFNQDIILYHNIQS